MLCRPFFRHAFLVSASFSNRRLTTMASPQSFTLDRNIFNPELHRRVNDVWFAGLPEGARSAVPANFKRWFGVNASAEDKQALDDECRYARSKSVWRWTNC